MTRASSLAVRPLARTDEDRWRQLFRGYRDFYLLQEDESVVSTTWAWLIAPAHECNALVAEMDGHILGIAHYRAFPRPSTGTVGIWLDDLFTDPDARGRGVARALIERLTRIAGAEERSVVRWITANDNEQAQALYDQLAVRTSWVTYDAAPAAEQAWDGEQHHGAH
ncbi:acetyltransferase (GNAT) family protein [Leucobacter luti]|uniref:GNAT family N-acetyltransferase n=1 Tax=Leucobacter luti TaxID=340320 RepID=UPI001051E3AA|nr:GNAT family N-acetyltransferase [Leucobacter luti]MCW2289148.1 GNAT superfamily N-acetyltransferase [Leucobacter luti]TCK35455.1 acetyltransferase (GNAT) family protein [Leucobacter luti]